MAIAHSGSHCDQVALPAPRRQRLGPRKFPGTMQTTPEPQDCLGPRGTPVLRRGGAQSPGQQPGSQIPLHRIRGSNPDFSLRTPGPGPSTWDPWGVPALG